MPASTLIYFFTHVGTHHAVGGNAGRRYPCPSRECGKERRHVTAQFVDCRHHYMRWPLVVELLYALSQVGLVDVYAVTPHELAYAAFVHCHGLAFGHGLTLCCRNMSSIMLLCPFGVAGPVHMYSVGFRRWWRIVADSCRAATVCVVLSGMPARASPPIRVWMQLPCRVSYVPPRGSGRHLAVCLFVHKLGSELYLVYPSHGFASPLRISVI